jgi:predicted PhzF superfamily epimerase YddE/YHI9
MGLDLSIHFGEEQLQADAFVTTGAFTGNPAAVVFSQRDTTWMQNVAMENNLAETAFVEKVSDNNYKLRW